MEIWKDIKGYEGYYQVSENGKVRSLDHYRNGINGSSKLYKGKILNGYVNNLGYVCFDLYKERKRTNIKSHTLVCYHFNDGYEVGLWVNHKDGNKQNNHYLNLEWVTPKENSIHAFDKRLIVRKGSIVLNLKTGIFYESVRQAHKYEPINCSRSHFQKQLTCKVENMTDFIII